MPVMVDRLRAADRAHHLIQQRQIAGGIFLLAKHRRGHRAGGVVNGGQQTQPRSPLLEPGMVAGIELQQHPGLRHAFPAPSVRRWPPLARPLQARRHPQAPHRRAREHQAFCLGEQLGQVAVVEPGVGRARQIRHPPPQRGIQRMSWGASAVAMG